MPPIAKMSPAGPTAFASPRWPAPGSLPWLILHEVRLAFRSGRRGTAKWIRLGLLLAFFLFGLFIAYRLRDTPLEPKPRWLITGNAALLVMFTFMATQSLLQALRTLFEKTDLDLLLSSPLPEGRVLAAKMLGIGASAAATYFLLLLPISLPVALLGHPRLFAMVPVAAALAMLSATLGLALAILLVRRIGARGARSVGTIIAAGTGGIIYLVSQLSGQYRPGRGRVLIMADWLKAHHWGVSGWSAVPARALFGEIGPLVLLVGVSGTLFALTSWLFRTRFLASVQSAGDRSGRRSAAGRGPAFRGGLAATVVGKEVRLLLREPEIVFLVLLRLIYLFPLVLLGTGRAAGSEVAIPVLAAVGVVAAGQLCGSVSWLTISAEDAPDLLAVSPVDAGRLKRMKLLAALAIVSPVAAIVPVVLLFRGGLLAALITYAGTAVAGAGAGGIELLLGKPAKRSTFRRRQGSLLTSLLGVLLSMVAGGLTAAAVYFV